MIDAAILEAGSLFSGEVYLSILVLGFLVIVIVGYASLRLLLKIVVEGKFHLLSNLLGPWSPNHTNRDSKEE
jgi:undecaprenyl pyrophosphate phosphatase UppP